MYYLDLIYVLRIEGQGILKFCILVTVGYFGILELFELLLAWLEQCRVVTEMPLLDDF